MPCLMQKTWHLPVLCPFLRQSFDYSGRVRGTGQDPMDIDIPQVPGSCGVELKERLKGERTMHRRTGQQGSKIKRRKEEIEHAVN